MRALSGLCCPRENSLASATSSRTTPAPPQVPNFRYKPLKHMDSKYLRNLKFSKKWQKGGRPKEESSDEESDGEESS